MKEVDFLPEWYKVGRKRQVSYKRQYVAIISVFTLLIMWSFALDWAASSARAKIAVRNNFLAVNCGLEGQCERIKLRINDLLEKSQILDKLVPKMDFADVVAELSCLVNENIIIRELKVSSEPITLTGSANQSVAASAAVVVIRPAENPAATVFPLENCRFRVTLSGIASAGSDVAVLISRLESSSYFREIIPEFSRNVQVNNRDVTEFQINCYVANYTQDG